MCVDDSEPIRKLVALVLRVAGHHVTEIADGAEALRQLQVAKYDLLITDVNMPGMSGLELIREARKIYPEIPILVLTTECQQRMTAFGPSESADGWVQKPFEPRPFTELVGRLLS